MGRLRNFGAMAYAGVALPTSYYAAAEGAHRQINKGLNATTNGSLDYIIQYAPTFVQPVAELVPYTLVAMAGIYGIARLIRGRQQVQQVRQHGARPAKRV